LPNCVKKIWSTQHLLRIILLRFRHSLAKTAMTPTPIRAEEVRWDLRNGRLQVTRMAGSGGR